MRGTNLCLDGRNRSFFIVCLSALSWSLVTGTRASNVWDGGGSSPKKWSDPLNWSDDQLPSNSGTLTFPTFDSTAQDLFTATAGVPNSNFSGIQLTGGWGGLGSEPPTFALGMAHNGRIAADAPGFYGIDGPLLTAGALRVEVVTSSSIHLQSIIEQPGVTSDVIINADPAHGGTVQIYSPDVLPTYPTYRGTTTISHGTLAFGALGFGMNTQGQGSYTIGADAAMLAQGTIGLAAGNIIDNSGTLGVNGDGPIHPLNVIGSLKMNAGSTLIPEIFHEAPGAPTYASPINVTGTLDLSAVDDALLVHLNVPPVPVPAGSYVLSNYGNRIGVFDDLAGLQPGWTISYSSLENAGPGQVILNVPEPSMLLALSAALLLTCPRARR